MPPISAKLSASMRTPRRRLLGFLGLGLGSKFLPGGSVFAVAGQATNLSKEAAGMEKVTGIGGLFFRAHDPKGLARWYQEHLGVTTIPSSGNEQVWEQEAGPTAFAPFPETTKYFGDMQKAWMVNFRVRLPGKDGGSTAGCGNRGEDRSADVPKRAVCAVA